MGEVLPFTSLERGDDVTLRGLELSDPASPFPELPGADAFAAESADAGVMARTPWGGHVLVQLPVSAPELHPRTLRVINGWLTGRYPITVMRNQGLLHVSFAVAGADTESQRLVAEVGTATATALHQHDADAVTAHIEYCEAVGTRYGRETPARQQVSVFPPSSSK